MKRSPFLFLILLGLLTFSGCYSALHIHQQLLSACHNRQDVAKRLGPPDEKIYSHTTEEWVYNLDSRGYHHAPPIIDSVDTGTVINYNKNLKFIFDLQGNVITRESNIADPVKAIIKRDEQITAMGIVGATLLLGLLIYVTAKTGASF